MASQMGMGRYQWALFFLCGFGYVCYAPLLWSSPDNQILPRSRLGSSWRFGRLGDTAGTGCWRYVDHLQPC